MDLTYPISRTPAARRIHAIERTGSRTNHGALSALNGAVNQQYRVWAVIDGDMYTQFMNQHLFMASMLDAVMEAFGDLTLSKLLPFGVLPYEPRSRVERRGNYVCAHDHAARRITLAESLGT